MKQYIDKDALLARIKLLKMDVGNIFNEYDEGFWDGRGTAFDDVICALDTLKVKKVDLEKEINNELDRTWYGEYLDTDKFKESVIYFFELGLNAQKGENV